YDPWLAHQRWKSNLSLPVCEDVSFGTRVIFWRTKVYEEESPIYTLKHGKPDHEAPHEANVSSPIEYPKPNRIVSFDVPTSLYRSNTNHDHDQPAHLRLRDPQIPERVNLPKYGGPESRFCPARVYEYIPDDNGQPKLQINA
ncbi:electron transfer flavoprotein-ubiquinone oxidoreductase, mitochondrial isoform X2, partial [Tanacetum coccineum]